MVIARVHTPRAFVIERSLFHVDLVAANAIENQSKREFVLKRVVNKEARRRLGFFIGLPDTMKTRLQMQIMLRDLNNDIADAICEERF